MESNILNLLHSSLKIYDLSNIKFRKYINQMKLIIQTNGGPIFENIKTGELENVFHSEILGILYDKVNLFFWGWLLPTDNIDNIYLLKLLLNYSISITNINSNNTYIRSILLNSRIKINNSVELDFLLALVQHILKSNCDFIYPDRVYDKNGNLVYTIFRIIKISKD
jgi:hypothetical protein